MENSSSTSVVTNSDTTGSASKTVDNKMYEHLKQGTGISGEDLALATRDRESIEFVFDYSKRWCKFVKDLATCLEKRGNLETDCVRNVGKQFNLFATSGSLSVDMPLKLAVENMNQMFSEYCKTAETNNGKKFQNLLDALNRQRTHFENVRVKHKQIWKTELKKFLDAELNVCKMRTAYFQRCQAGVRLSEELTAAHDSLNELSVSMEATKFAAAVTAASSSGSNAALTGGTTSPGVGGFGTSISMSNFSTGSNVSNSSSASNIGATAQQISQQGRLQAKIDKLEKALSENDRKQQETMAAYRDSVTAANNQAQSLEKTKIHILCDIRLITTTNDEVVRNVMMEYMQHYNAFLQVFASKFNSVATLMGEYKPCSGYLTQINKRVENLSEIVPERFTFDDYFDTTNSKETSVGKFTVSGNDSFVTASSSGRGGQSDSEEEIDASSRNVFSHFVEISSNLFRQGDSKKPSIKKPKSAMAELSNTALENRCNTDAELASVYQVALRCINEIENHSSGLVTNGIYRVPASKVRVSTMLESFATSRPEDVDLSEEHPLTLASVLKGRLISLAEPLLTWNLYGAFVSIGKDVESGTVPMQDILKRIKETIGELPLYHRIIAGLLFHHLKRVADHQSENQMGASNLGTLFGPTLLRQKSKFRTANMMEFVDNKSQSKVVELMIDNVETLFGGSAEYYHSSIFQKDGSGSPVVSQPPTPETTIKLQTDINKTFSEESSDKISVKEERHPIATRPVNFVPSKPVPFSASATSRVTSNTSSTSLDVLNSLKTSSSATIEMETVVTRSSVLTVNRVAQATSSSLSTSSYASRRHASAIIGSREENGISSSGMRNSFGARRRLNENQSNVSENLATTSHLSTYFSTRTSASPKSTPDHFHRSKALSLQDLTSISFLQSFPSNYSKLNQETQTLNSLPFGYYPKPVSLWPSLTNQSNKSVYPLSNRRYSASTNALDHISLEMVLSSLTEEEEEEEDTTPSDDALINPSIKLSSSSHHLDLEKNSHLTHLNISQSRSSECLFPAARSTEVATTVAATNNGSGISYFFSDFKRAIKSRFRTNLRDSENSLSNMLWHKTPQVHQHHPQCQSNLPHSAAVLKHQQKCKTLSPPSSPLSQRRTS